MAITNVKSGNPLVIPKWQAPELKLCLGNDGTLYVLDAVGNMQPISDLIPSSGGGSGLSILETEFDFPESGGYVYQNDILINKSFVMVGLTIGNGVNTAALSVEIITYANTGTYYYNAESGEVTFTNNSPGAHGYGTIIYK